MHSIHKVSGDLENSSSYYIYLWTFQDCDSLLLVWFLGTGFLCVAPGCPWTHSVNQAGLRDLCHHHLAIFKNTVKVVFVSILLKRTGGELFKWFWGWTPRPSTYRHLPLSYITNLRSNFFKCKRKELRLQIQQVKNFELLIWLCEQTFVLWRSANSQLISKVE